MYRLLLSLMIVFAFGLTACSSDKKDSSDSSEMMTQEEMEKNPVAAAQQAMKMAAEQMQKTQNGEAVEVIDYKELKALMPEQLLGMDRYNLDGQKTGMGAFNIAMAEAKYKKDAKNIEVRIVDGAGAGMMQMGMAAWLQTEFDRESDDGYERTSTIDGMKAFEKYNTKDESGEVTVFAKNRYLLTVSGDRVTEQEIRQALNKINIGSLPN